MTDYLTINSDGSVVAASGGVELNFSANNPRLPSGASAALVAKMNWMSLNNVDTVHMEVLPQGDMTYTRSGLSVVVDQGIDQSTYLSVTENMQAIQSAIVEPVDPPTQGEIRAAMAPLTRRQTFIMLASEGFLTEQEAEDAAAGNAVPSVISGTFDALVASGTWTAAERMGARITFLSFTHAYRLDPMVPILVSSQDPAPTDEQLDAWWQAYANV